MDDNTAKTCQPPDDPNRLPSGSPQPYTLCVVPKKPDRDAEECRIPPREDRPRRNLPQVTLTLKCLPEAVDDAVVALVSYNGNRPTLFQRNGELVSWQAEGQFGDGPGLRVVDAAELQCVLTYVARWLEVSEGGVKPVYPPPMLVRDLVRRLSEWAPPLADVVHVPILGASGGLMFEPGYHSEQQILYTPNHQPLGHISAQPTHEDVARARQLLCERVLGRFPFASPPQLSTALAAMIVPFVRHHIDGPVPLHVFDALQVTPDARLLANITAVPALGPALPAISDVTTSAQLRKWITERERVGAGAGLIENINAHISSPALASILADRQSQQRTKISAQRPRPGRCILLASGTGRRFTERILPHCNHSGQHSGVEAAERGAEF
jgi:hypothetical protein